MELGFGWLDMVYTVVRLFIAVSLIYFLCMMVRLWNVLKSGARKPCARSSAGGRTAERCYEPLS